MVVSIGSPFMSFVRLSTRRVSVVVESSSYSSNIYRFKDRPSARFSGWRAGQCSLVHLMPQASGVLGKAVSTQVRAIT